MIKLFLDLDETLIHCQMHYSDWSADESFELEIPGDPRAMFVKPRPSADELFSRVHDKIGMSNMYILTNSSKVYATKVIEELGWPFEAHQTITVEDLNCHLCDDSIKVLVDNLHPKYNSEKMRFLGIDEHNYLQVASYYGGEDNPMFVTNVIEFIDEQCITT